MGQRIAYFDNAKFFLILLVVIGHFADTIKGTSELAVSAVFFIYSFHMPVFIFINGIFYKREKIEQNIVFFLSLFFLTQIIVFIKKVYLYDVYTHSIFDVESYTWYFFALSAWYIIKNLLNNVNMKYVLTVSIIIALFIGYDENIGQMFSLSRIIVYYPFFLLGTMVSKDWIINITNKKYLKIIAALIILFSVYFWIVYIEDVRPLVGPLLNGSNSYILLGDHAKFGIFIRLALYFVEIIVGSAFMILIPKRKTIISDMGMRTVSVYCLHMLFINTIPMLISCRLIVLIFISIVLVVLLSSKFVYWPFKKAHEMIKNHNR